MERNTFVWVAVIITCVGLASDPIRIGFATYNVQSFPDLLQKILYNSNQDRVEHIPKELSATALSFLGQDPSFICFQEAFSGDIRDHIHTFAVANGYYYLGPISSDPRNFQLINGGVVLLSKTPFIYAAQRGFPTNTTCGADRLARKGFLYVETMIQGLTIGVIATHLQADDRWCAFRSNNVPKVAKRKRLLQLNCIKDFLDHEVNNRHVDAMFVVGDLSSSSFNIQTRLIDFALISEELQILGADIPEIPVKSSPSYDFQTNTYLGELLKKEKIELSPNEHIDYVLARKQDWAKISVMNVVVPVQKKSADLSDHHAVLSSVTISRLSKGSLSTSSSGKGKRPVS